MGDEDFPRHAWETGRAFLTALVISLVAGLFIGLALGAYRLSGEVAEPVLTALYSIPKITLYPVILLLFGLGISAKIAFGVIHGIIPVILFTMNAVRNIRVVCLRSARAMRLTLAQTAFTIIVPAALPEIVSGFRVGFALTLLGTLIGEMFASQRGIGYMLVKAMETGDTGTVTALAPWTDACVDMRWLHEDCRMTKTRLKTILESGQFVVAPGVFDMFSAKVADRVGFHALYMTGYGVSASYLGVADAGLVTYRDMVERARTIADGTSVPLIADADTGFGGLINVRQTVRGYEAAGVQAIQIEDQEMPKKCGHTPNRRVIPAADMCRKIEVAVDARTRPDMLIIARTDSRTGLGLDEAIRRGQDYARAGADIVFVEAPETEDEFKHVGEKVDCWLLANMVPTGKSPVVSAENLKAFGFNIAIYPSAGMSVVCAALEANYGHLKTHGSTDGSPVPAYTMTQLHELTGFPEVWEFEKRFAEV